MIKIIILFVWIIGLTILGILFLVILPWVHNRYKQKSKGLVKYKNTWVTPEEAKGLQIGKEKKEWYKKWWVIAFFIIFGIGIIGALIRYPSHQTENISRSYIEISIYELYSIFSDSSSLSDIQKEDKYKKEFDGKLIKTSIRADTIDRASLSSNYVAIKFRTPISCEAKAFFPSQEKDNLIKANIGDTIVFTGKLVNYKFGLVSCLEFSDSKVLKIIHKNESGIV